MKLVECLLECLLEIRRKVLQILIKKKKTLTLERECKCAVGKQMVHYMKILRKDFFSYEAATLAEDSSQWSVLFCMEIPPRVF